MSELNEGGVEVTSVMGRAKGVSIRLIPSEILVAALRASWRSTSYLRMDYIPEAAPRCVSSTTQTIAQIPPSTHLEQDQIAQR